MKIGDKVYFLGAEEVEFMQVLTVDSIKIKCAEVMEAYPGSTAIKIRNKDERWGWYVANKDEVYTSKSDLIDALVKHLRA